MEVHGGIRPLPRVALLVACVGMMAGMRHDGWPVAHDCLHGHDMDLWAVFAMFYRTDFASIPLHYRDADLVRVVGGSVRAV